MADFQKELKPIHNTPKENRIKKIILIIQFHYLLSKKLNKKCERIESWIFCRKEQVKLNLIDNCLLINIRFVITNGPDKRC